MPVVALGRAEWTTDEVSHLNECAACQQEWELVQVASRLGEQAGLSLDSASIASGVIRRLDLERNEAGLRRRAWSFAGLAAAAALIGAIWTGALDSRPVHEPIAGTEVAGRLSIPLPELETLEPSELDSVLQTLEEPVANGSDGDDPALGDLNTDELERVLDSWEG
jgi:hypothetical protein